MAPGKLNFKCDFLTKKPYISTLATGNVLNIAVAMEILVFKLCMEFVYRCKGYYNFGQMFKAQ